MNQTNTKIIPFLDLVAPHFELREELCRVFNGALDTAGFIGGAVVQRFEKEFAAFCEAKQCVGVGSGTDALRFALIAAGVGKGDIAITVPNTFIATTEAISQAGARPVFVDVDEITYNLNPDRLKDYLERDCDLDSISGTLIDRKTKYRVKVIIPVHLYGQMADMDPILELAERYKLIVIEDACQAHGAEYFSRKDNRWWKAGSMGKAAAFSFYPGKNLGACGEAGAAITNDEDLAQKMRMLRDHGQSQKYFHEIEGYNGRLDAIQAGILSVKLRQLAAWNQQRRERAGWYRELLGQTQTGMALPEVPSWARAVFHLYVVRVANREEFQAGLSAAAIGTAIHYPVPLHLQKAYTHLDYRAGDFPIAERCAAEIVSLPMFPSLGYQELKRVAECARTLVSGEHADDFMAKSLQG